MKSGAGFLTRDIFDKNRKLIINSIKKLMFFNFKDIMRLQNGIMLKETLRGIFKYNFGK